MDECLQVNGAGQGPVSAEWMVPKSLWLKNERPDIWGKCATVCEFQVWNIKCESIDKCVVIEKMCELTVNDSAACISPTLPPPFPEGFYQPPLDGADGRISQQCVRKVALLRIKGWVIAYLF